MSKQGNDDLVALAAVSTTLRGLTTNKARGEYLVDILGKRPRLAAYLRAGYTGRLATVAKVFTLDMEPEIQAAVGSVFTGKWEQHSGVPRNVFDRVLGKLGKLPLDTVPHCMVSVMEDGTLWAACFIVGMEIVFSGFGLRTQNGERLVHEWRAMGVTMEYLGAAADVFDVPYPF
jgi:hypothetical protein